MLRQRHEPKALISRPPRHRATVVHTSVTQSEQSPSCCPSSTEKDKVASRDLPATELDVCIYDLASNSPCLFFDRHKED